MSYGKSALLERRIRALVRETAALLREAGETKIASEKIGKPYKIQDYVVKAISPLSYVYFKADGNPTEVGTSTPENSDAGEWNEWAGLINSAGTNESNAANGILSGLPDANQAKVDFIKATPSATTAPSAPKASTALKEIQGLLKITPDGVWGKQTEAAWEGFITVARGKVPDLPDDIVTNWKAAAPEVKVNGATFKPDYTGMLAFMKAVIEMPRPSGGTSATTSAATATSAAAPNDKISATTTTPVVNSGAQIMVSATYAPSGTPLDLNGFSAVVKDDSGTEVDKVKPTLAGAAGKNNYDLKIKTEKLNPGVYTVTVQGYAVGKTKGTRVLKYSDPVTFTVK